MPRPNRAGEVIIDYVRRSRTRNNRAQSARDFAAGEIYLCGIRHAPQVAAGEKQFFWVRFRFFAVKRGYDIRLILCQIEQGVIITHLIFCASIKSDLTLADGREGGTLHRAACCCLAVNGEILQPAQQQQQQQFYT